MSATSQSFSIVIGLIGGPISLVVVSGITGFGYKGFDLYRSKCDNNVL